MAGQEIVLFEKQLAPLAPRFAEVLGRTMPVERLIRTIVVSAERLPKLLDCDRQSLFNAAMSAACLGLEVDGVTGQAFLIPFKGRAQLVIGYKGYNTLAARSGLSVSGGVVREGDEFDYELGSGAFIRHKPKLGEPGRRIIAAWSVAAANDRPPIVQVLSLDELMATKNRSPGARMSDSPWNDNAIGFPAMCEKTAKRRLARSMPLNVMQNAARMDEAVEEQGKHAWITPERGVVIDGDFSPLPPRDTQTPTTAELLAPVARGGVSPAATGSTSAASVPNGEAAGAVGDAVTPSAQDYVAKWDARIAAATPAGREQMVKDWNAEKDVRGRILWPDDTFDGPLRQRVMRAIEFLKG